MVIHHVEMDDVSAGGDDVADFFPKTGEIGGQNAGGDAIVGHGSDFVNEAAILPCGLQTRSTR